MCQRTRSAADVQQPAGAIQPECGDQNLHHFSRVGDAPGRVVSRTPRVQRGIPAPFRLVLRVKLVSRHDDIVPRHVWKAPPPLMEPTLSAELGSSRTDAVSFKATPPAGMPRELGSGPKPSVKVAEQRDLSSMVYLLVQQDGDDLARGAAAPEVAGTGFEQITVAGRRQPGRHGSATVLPVRQDLGRRAMNRKIGKGAQTWPEGV